MHICVSLLSRSDFNEGFPRFKQFCNITDSDTGMLFKASWPLLLSLRKFCQSIRYD